MSFSSLLEQLLPMVGSSAVVPFLFDNDTADFGDDFNLTDLVCTLTAGRDWMSVVREGKSLDQAIWTGPEGHPEPGKVMDAYQRGYTLLMRRMQLRYPKIATLCREFDTRLIAAGHLLKRPVRSNLFASPARSLGLAKHWDDHDVIVLQISGHKHWTVNEPVYRSPLDPPKQRLTAEDIGNEVFSGTLQPGDGLFVPRGFPHATQTGAVPSIHLTLGVDLVRWIELIVALSSHIESLRHNVPPRDWASPTELDAHAGLGELITGTVTEALTRRAAADLSASALGLSRPLELEHGWDEEPPTISLSTPLRRSIGALSQLIDLLDGEICWVTSGLSLTFGHDLSDCIRFIDGIDRTFCPLEFPCPADDLKLAIATQLVQAGYVRILGDATIDGLPG